MQQEQGRENGEDRNQAEEEQAKGKPIWSVTGTAIAIQVYIIVLFLLLVFIPAYVQDYAAAVKVCIESMFSLAIVDVIVVHAIMYYKQAQEANRQTEISTKSLMVSQQSYVGIHSIADRGTPQGDIILIKLENIGHVPADQIAVNIHLNGLLLDRAMIPPDVRPEFGHARNEHFGRTKLFPGKLKIEIVLPYDKYFFPSERMLNEAGRMTFYVWGKIIYNDGFGEGKETEFSFYRRRDGRWIVAAPWSPNVIEMLEREQSHKRPEHKKPN